MRQNFFILLIATILIVVSCNTSNESSTPSGKFIDVSAMDSSVKPGDNFYLYANGGWIKRTEIPPTEAGLGSFLDLYNKTKGNLHFILDSLSKTTLVTGSVEQKATDFYASGMDTSLVDQRGSEPLKPYLQQIDAIKTPLDVMHYVASQQTELNSALFNLGIGPDDKNSKVNIASFLQGGLGLPDRDYYFKKDPATLAVIKAYQNYLQKLFQLLGSDSIAASKKMALVYELEKQMATSHKTNVQLRDPQSNYHKMAVAELDKSMPAFGWKKTLADMNIVVDSVNVQQPEFFKKVNDLLTKTPIDTWKEYLRAHTAD